MKLYFNHLITKCIMERVARNCSFLQAFSTAKSKAELSSLIAVATEDEIFALIECVYNIKFQDFVLNKKQLTAQRESKGLISKIEKLYKKSISSVKPTKSPRFQIIRKLMQKHSSIIATLTGAVIAKLLSEALCEICNHV
jgi:hypothetical protein